MTENYDEISTQLHLDIERYERLNKEYKDFVDAVCKDTPCSHCPYNDGYSCYANDLLNAMLEI